jgi:beta-phosphoglucomutase family hydrolase
VKAIIFDMDGVLVDTEPIYFAANRVLFERLGFSVTQEGYARFIGLDANRMWAQLKAEHALPQPIPELVTLERDAMYRALLQADLTPMDGLIPLLDDLQRRGIRLAIASSSARQIINTILDKTGLRAYFAVIASGEDAAHGKPAPDIFLLAAERLGIAAADCTVIEDAAAGVRGAKAAGMRVIGLRSPGSGAQDLGEADAIIHSLKQLAGEPWLNAHG